MEEIKGTTFPKTKKKKKKEILNFNKQEILIKPRWVKGKLKWEGKKTKPKNQLSILIGFDMLHNLLFVFVF